MHKKNISMVHIIVSCLLISTLFTACGKSSSNYADNRIETTEVETEPTTVTPTEPLTETPTEKAHPIYYDKDGNFFKVRSGMSQEDIIKLFGKPHGDYSDTFCMYYVNNMIQELDCQTNEELYDDYKGYNLAKYCFSFSSGKLYSWSMDTDYFYDNYEVCNYLENSILPCLIEDYPELENNEDYFRPDIPFLAKDNLGKFSIGYYIFSYGESISFMDERYYHSSGNYDPNDKYYKNNDYDNDGYIDDDEFQNAVGDWMDDHGY